MTNRFRNKYRITTTRLPNWDYGWNAAYFITICTADRTPYFGSIPMVQKEMELSHTGQIVFDLWQLIPENFPFITLDEFVIMPDHIHGIIVIDKNDGDHHGSRCAINRASTNTDAGGITGNKNPMLHDNLSRIIRWFKGRSTFECRKINEHFGWQSRFYDHIIRDRESHDRIRNYIRNNPLNWKQS